MMPESRSRDHFAPAPAPNPFSAPFLVLSALLLILGAGLLFVRGTRSDRA